MLVNELKKDGVISKAMFGVYLTTTNQESKIHFGGFDQAIVDKSIRENGEVEGSENGIFWMNINSNYHWQVKMFNAKIGDKIINVSAPNMIFDTGSSLNYIPA